MKYENEAQLMKTLGIETWRNLSKDKVLQFAAMMPEMDLELAKSIVSQFPEFRKLIAETVDSLQQAHDATLAANEKSQDQVHNAYAEVREILRGELNRDLDPETRVRILEMILETGDRQAMEDSKNKAFLKALFDKRVLLGVAATALAVVFVGGRVGLQSSEDSEQDSSA